MPLVKLWHDKIPGITFGSLSQKLWVLFKTTLSLHVAANHTLVCCYLNNFIMGLFIRLFFENGNTGNTVRHLHSKYSLRLSARGLNVALMLLINGTNAKVRPFLSRLHLIELPWISLTPPVQCCIWTKKLHPLKKCKSSVVLVGACCFKHRWESETWSRKASLS